MVTKFGYDLATREKAQAEIVGILGERARSGAGPITYGDLARQITDHHADPDLPAAPADAVGIGVEVVDEDGTEPRVLAADAPAKLDAREREKPTAEELEALSTDMLGIVERPLVERDDPLPGRLDELLAELDRLGQDDLLLGGQEGHRADLPEVHPDRVVDPDHGRRELLGGRLLALLRVELGGSIGGECARLGPVLVDYLDTADDRVGGCRGQVEIGVVVRIGGKDRDSARHSRHDGGLAGCWRA